MLDLVTSIAGELSAGIPDPGSGEAPPGSGAILTILGWLRWIAGAIAVGAVIAVGILFMIRQRRGEASDAAGSLVTVLIGIILIGSAVSVVSFVVTAV